jgi:CIC family chloride channel protein
MSLLELSFNPGVIFPGMLVVVSANLVAGRLFRQPGIFQMLLATRGLMLSR